jgi:hypothetical protein
VKRYYAAAAHRRVAEFGTQRTHARDSGLVCRPGSAEQKDQLSSIDPINLAIAGAPRSHVAGILS